MAEMFANMPEGVLVTDANGCIEFANQAFCRLFDLPENPSGKTVMEAIRIHQANDLIERLKVESSIEQEEFMLPNLDQRYLQANGVAIREKDGRHRGTILMFHDLTRMKRLENLRRVCRQRQPRVAHATRSSRATSRRCSMPRRIPNR